MSKAARLDDPDTFGGLVDVIGWPAAEALVLRWGGQRKWINRKMLEDAALVDLLGEPAARRLVSHYENSEVYFPVQLRNQIRVQRMAAEGRSEREIVEATGLSYRGVQKIRARSSGPLALGTRQAAPLPLIDWIESSEDQRQAGRTGSR